ncbi:MAG TPA: FUSC family protein [Solirubrobacteraceae bacterium]|nr:FUSC family protein [Solirubrobacteraceae bacterium]
MLRRRDPALLALRRATRTAVVMPAMFALGEKVIGNPAVATFAAFGSFALLLLVDFPGPMRARLQAQAALALTGAVFVVVGTLASQRAGLAAVAMGLVAFGVLFAGVVSSVLAGATTSLLLAFILPVSLQAPASAIPDRLAGWGLASGASLLAIALLWPAPARDPVRDAAIAACRAMAARLRSRSAAPEADAALGGLHDLFFATPYRPTGLSTAARAVVRLVDELRWLNAVAGRAVACDDPAPRDERVRDATDAAASVLERSADLLADLRGSPESLHAAVDDLGGKLVALERSVMVAVPGGDVISALDPSFRARELSFVVSQIARNVDVAAAAERRSWLAQLLGRQPPGIGGTLDAAAERAGAHVSPHSVWLQNSVRGAVGLALAVLIASLSGVQHSFWVVLGTLSVLRSSALSTGQNVLRGLLGTVVGFVVGGVLVALIGTNTTVLWLLLPVAVLFAGLAPATISFAAGQAAFTLVLLILFNILAPEGWQIGLVRIEDIAIGSAVSLAVGLLFWPRGAAAALGNALAAAYADSARYLAGAVQFGLGRCDNGTLARPAPTTEAIEAAAAARRLDDTFRTYLAERGQKPVPMAEVTSLVTGVVGLRLAGDAVLDLWNEDGDGDVGAERAAARRELLAASDQMTGWYDAFAGSLTGHGDVPEPQAGDPDADDRLVAAVDADLRGEDGHATSTAVQVIWTGDHLDAARRLQALLAEPARTAVREHALDADQLLSARAFSPSIAPPSR